MRLRSCGWVLVLLTLSSFGWWLLQMALMELEKQLHHVTSHDFFSRRPRKRPVRLISDERKNPAAPKKATVKVK